MRGKEESRGRKEVEGRREMERIWKRKERVERWKRGQVEGRKTGKVQY